MSFTDDQLLPISALQHLRFCPRQCALIHIEGLWAENRFTVEGQHLHEKTHDPNQTDSIHNVKITRSLSLVSRKLGITGKADVVEFHSHPKTKKVIQVLPIEYKRGKPKIDNTDAVQLCAQVLCLEDMLHVNIDRGMLYYGKTRRRFEVAIDQSLRTETLALINQLHQLISFAITPLARRSKKCDNCSLIDLCLPGALKPRATASRYLQRAIDENLNEESSP